MRHGELPDGLVLRRTTPDFDETTVPAGLTREHRIAPNVWGLLRVLAGEVVFVEEDRDDGGRTTLRAGDEMVIVPDTPHHVEPGTGALFHVEFHAPVERTRQEPSAETIAANLAVVRDGIDRAARAAGRDPSEVRLLPVSKTFSPEVMRRAVAAGCTEFAENKVQEAKRKAAELSDLDLRWAVVGHLQTNKAKDVAAFAHEFHALDRVRVAEALDRRLRGVGRTLDVYVQVNTSGEESKFGLAPEELDEFLAELPRFDTLKVRGLMTLAINSPNDDAVRDCFGLLRELRDRTLAEGTLPEGGLSMGMSGDYAIAIEQGATVVRIGQAIFGSRPVPDSHYWPPAGGPSGESRPAG